MKNKPFVNPNSLQPDMDFQRSESHINQAAMQALAPISAMPEPGDHSQAITVLASYGLHAQLHRGMDLNTSAWCFLSSRVV